MWVSDLPSLSSCASWGAPTTLSEVGGACPAPPLPQAQPTGLDNRPQAGGTQGPHEEQGRKTSQKLPFCRDSWRKTHRSLQLLGSP